MSMRYPGGLIAPTPVNQQFPSGVWTGPQSAPYQANNVWGNDSSFKNTTLLLHGDGATTPFTQDASTNNFQLTIAGDTKPNNLTPFVTSGYWSNFFSATGSYLSVPYSADFNLTGDFTIEFWINPTNLPTSTGSAAQSYCRVFSFGTYNAANSLGLEINSNDSGNIRKLISWYNGTSYGLSTNNAVTINSWQHIALVRSGTTITCYINGTSTGLTITGASAAVNTSQSFYIATLQGFEANSSAQYAGYLSNFSILKGTAKYTSNFTPTTSPLSTSATNQTLLTCYGNRFYDANTTTTAKTITATGSPSVSMQQPFTAPSGTSLYGSGYFDGTGDYLTSPNVAFASNNFTIEGWFYPTTIANLTNFWGMDNGSGSTPKMIMYINSSGNLTLDMGNAGTTQFPVSASASTYLTANAWNHIAIVRSGTGAGQLALYINGTSVSTGQLGTNISSITAAFNIGYIGEAYGQTFSGYVSNFRIVNGTAVYTGNFTPSTTPLTPVSGTSLLTLQTNGPENNNGFLDSSYNSFPVTRNGNPTQGAYSPYGANWSSYLGTSNGFSFGGESAFALGTGDYTIECWFYKLGSAGSIILDFRPSGTNGNYPIIYHTAGVCGLDINGAVLSSGTVALNTWNHMALVRASGVTKFYINGTQSGSSLSDTRNYLVGASRPYIGINGYTPQDYFDGYISNLRIVKGTAVYTSNFTPSTTPLTAISGTSVLTLQSNRFVDNSANNFTVTPVGTPTVQRFAPFAPTVQYTPSTLGGSGYFDGSGDYLNLASNSQTAFQSNNFTIELWVYLTNASANALQTFYSNYTVFATAGSIFFGKHSSNSGAVTFWISGYSTGGPLLAESTLPPGNQWVHYAVTRNGNTFSLYRNGVLSTSSTAYTGAATTSSNPNYVGVPGDATNNYFFNGYMSDFRIVNGTAVYTGAFTPPTAPLTPIANTALLLPYTNAAIFDNSGMTNLETVGNAQIDTSVVKYGTSSMYFDGSGDYLTAYRNFSIAASENFTVEGWFYLTAAQANYRMIVSDGTKYFTVNSGGMEIQFGAVSGTIANATYAFSQNVWYHIAVVRNNNVVAIYVNGIALTMSQASQSAAFLDTGTLLYVSRYTSGTDYPWFGYIDDLRITKGVARYVTNFTPPVARMPNQ